MHQRPSRSPSSLAASSTLVRLVVAAVLAGTGTVLLLSGLGSMASPGASGSVPPGSAAAISPEPPTATDAGPGAATPSPTAGVQTPTGDPVLVGAGDIGRCDSDADEATAALVAELPGIVFTLGDNAYERGTAEEYRECFGPSWGRLRDRIALPVPGNHDHETDDAAGYREYFAEAAVPEGTTWYSRDVGPWHVVVLDSTCDRVDGGCGPDSPQLAWLRDDLAGSRARCTLALFHHPRFSSGDHGSEEAVQPMWDVLYAARADLVVNGHEHSYERFGPQDPAGREDRERGITQLIAGTGGADLRGFKDPLPTSRVRASLAHGVLSLTLGPSGWGFRFQSVDGSFTDEGRGTCH